MVETDSYNDLPSSLDPRSSMCSVDIVDTPEMALAKSLKDSKLLRRVYAKVAKFPHGANCSQAMQGLESGFRDRARTLGLPNNLSLLKVLAHCDGLVVQKVKKKNLIFLDASFCVDHAQVHANITDSTAALELLDLLYTDYGQRPWPSTKQQLKQYVISSIGQKASPALVKLHQRSVKKGLSESKKNKEAFNKVMLQFRAMGCLKGTNNDLQWDAAKITDCMQQRNIPTELSNESSMNVTSTSAKAGDLHIVFVDSDEAMRRVTASFPFNPEEETSFSFDKHQTSVVAMDCKGTPEDLFLIQVATSSGTYVFDCVKLGAKHVCESLQPLLTGQHALKIFHDLNRHTMPIARIGGVYPLVKTFDSQLAMEALVGDINMSFRKMLQHLGHITESAKRSPQTKTQGALLFASRPLSSELLEYSAQDASLLYQVSDILVTSLEDELRRQVQRASDERAKTCMESDGAQRVCFNAVNKYSMASQELLQELHPEQMQQPVSLVVSDDAGVLLEVLPGDLKNELSGRTQYLTEIALDKGRHPLAWIGGEREHLGPTSRRISQDDIDAIVEKLGGFGSDNRAGLERQLHRVSAIRNRQQDIIGLTLRVGRHVSGNAAMISDLLFSDCTRSILFLGEPGSGKTTVVREVTRQLAEQFNVCIVDTSNEIAGDGDVPHPCVGYARRMMVPSLDKQSSVMIECVQNHTPEVMIIDEVGRQTEVEAARTCKQRGVRLIASAHGDLRKLIKNPKLRGLVGGVETVTLGDAQAKEESKRLGNGSLQKLKTQRAGPPTFDIIVELRRGAQHEWRIVLDVGDAVDKVLEGQHYSAQRRTRNPDTGALTMELELA